MTDSTLPEPAVSYPGPPTDTFFITLRLAGSLPRTVVEGLRQQLQRVRAVETRAGQHTTHVRRKRYFRHFDQMLDQVTTGPTWLARLEVAEVVKAGMHKLDGQAYQLISYSVLFNHVHLLIRLLPNGPSLPEAVQQLKTFTTQHASHLIDLKGTFWHAEAYEQVVPNAEELQANVTYILENPVKADLVADWRKWPHSYWREL